MVTAMKKDKSKLAEARPILNVKPDLYMAVGETLPKSNPPRLYSQAVHNLICDELRKGQRPQGACARAGVTMSVFRDWIRKGKMGDPYLYNFAKDVELAFNEAEANAVDAITSKINPSSENNDIEAAKWWLERARPEGYSKQVKTAIDVQMKEFLLRLEEALEPHVFEQVLAVYLGENVIRPAELADGAQEDQ